MDIDKLRARLARENLSRLAARTGLHVRTLRRFRNQASMISLDTALRLREALRR